MKSKKKLPILLAEAIDLDKTQKSRANQIRQFSVSLATRLGITLEMVHVESISIFYEPRMPSFFSEYHEEKIKMLRNLTKSSVIKIKSIFLTGDPLAEIIHLCSKSNKYELIALATHGRQGLNRMVLGSVTEEVIRRSKIPVLSIGPNLKPEKTKLNDKKKLTLIVGTDFSKCSIRAEAYALDLALRLQAKVILIHCLYESFDPVLKLAFTERSRRLDLSEMYEKLKSLALQKLNKRKKRFEARGIEVTSVLDETACGASEIILAHISGQNGDLIFLGTHSRNLIKASLLGSSARAIIIGSPIPVITFTKRARS